MTFISRCSAETLKNITFFEKFGKKNAKFFSLFFPFFRGFSGKFFTRFLVVYKSLQSGFPKSTPEFPEIPGGKFREIFGHFFVDFSEKKSGNLEGLPCVPKRKLKKTRFFSKNRRNKKKPTLFFSEIFFCPPEISGGPFRETSTQHSLKPPKMAIFGGFRLCWVLVSRNGPPEISGGQKKISEKKSVGFFLFLRFFEKKRVFLSFRFGTQGRPSKFPDFFSEKSTKKWPKISRNFPPGISGNSGVDFGKPLCNDLYTTKNRVKNFPEKPRKNGKKSEKNFAFFFPNFSKKVMFFNVSALQRLINVINLQFSKSENSIKIYKNLFFDKILYNVL